MDWSWRLEGEERGGAWGDAWGSQSFLNCQLAMGGLGQGYVLVVSFFFFFFSYLINFVSVLCG